MLRLHAEREAKIAALDAKFAATQVQDATVKIQRVKQIAEKQRKRCAAPATFNF